MLGSMLAGHRSDDPTAVSVRGLRKSYGERTAVAGVDLDIPRGEVFALLGPNGAGKTTTVEILEGYRSRDAGEVSVLGVDPAAATPQWRARVAVIAAGAIIEVATPAELGGRQHAEATVSWTDPDGARRSVRTAEPTRTVTELAASLGGEVPDLSVSRPTLEDVYLE